MAITESSEIFVLSTVIFLRLSLLWRSSEDVLYLDNYAM